jgi:hypothetical protein
MVERKKVDWEAVEIQYRAGIRSLKDIGAEFGVSDAGILKRAKRDGWTRDLKSKIRAKADAKVSASLVSGEVSAQTKIAEAAVIEAESTVQARIRLTHRTDIARSRSLVMSLLGEVEAQTNDPELFDRLGELVIDTGSDAESKLLEAYRRVISTPGRIDGIKKLADSLKTLITLEREAYGLAEETPPPAAPSVTVNNAPAATLAEIQQVLKESAAAPKV